jgi:hypothetical protein
MRIAQIHSHLNGLEWLQVHHPEILKEIKGVIGKIDATAHRNKISKEKGMKGKALYAPIEINQEFKKLFDKLRWNESRTTYWVTEDYSLIRKTMLLPPPQQKEQIEAAGKRAIFSYNQTDFVKSRIAVEVQFGKYSFIAYDLFVKHLAFYVGDAIDLGVEILPMKVMQEQMSSGPGYYEGALYDLARQGRGVPAVPLIMIGIEP